MSDNKKPEIKVTLPPQAPAVVPTKVAAPAKKQNSKFDLMHGVVFMKNIWNFVTGGCAGMIATGTVSFYSQLLDPTF